MHGILRQPKVAHLGDAKLSLAHPERILDLDTHLASGTLPPCPVGSGHGRGILPGGVGFLPT